VEELPFENVEVIAEPDDENPFAHAAAPASEDLQPLLASARQMVKDLEAALARAREHERAIAARVEEKR
jgi:hypothetical protein